LQPKLEVTISFIDILREAEWSRGMLLDSRSDDRGSNLGEGIFLIERFLLLDTIKQRQRKLFSREIYPMAQISG